MARDQQGAEGDVNGLVLRESVSCSWRSKTHSEGCGIPGRSACNSLYLLWVPATAWLRDLLGHSQKAYQSSRTQAAEAQKFASQPRRATPVCWEAPWHRAALRPGNSKYQPSGSKGFPQFFWEICSYYFTHPGLYFC